MDDRRWVPILYRDFRDYPRMVLTMMGEWALLFDSPDEQAPDPDEAIYRVYRIPKDAASALAEEDEWVVPQMVAVLLGEVPVSHIQFDHTRTQWISARSIRHPRDDRGADAVGLPAPPAVSGLDLDAA